MDIYELIAKYERSKSPIERAVARIIDNLNDRKGVKQALQSVDDEIMEEIFESLADDIRSCVALGIND